MGKPLLHASIKLGIDIMMSLNAKKTTSIFFMIFLIFLYSCTENDDPEYQMHCDVYDYVYGYASCPQNHECFYFQGPKEYGTRCLRECCSNGTIQCPEGYFCTFPMNESGIMYCLEDYYKPIMESLEQKPGRAEVVANVTYWYTLECTKKNNNQEPTDTGTPSNNQNY